MGRGSFANRGGGGGGALTAMDGEVVITYTSPTTGKNMIGYINKKGVIKYQ